MSRYLQKLLNAKEPLFSNGLVKLEKISGNSGIDTRLIADIIEKSNKVMELMGLDQKDTNGRELYSALMAAAELGKFDDLLIDTDYVLVAKNETIISLNMIDVIENSHHGMSYDKQVVNHGQKSLMGELVARYVERANNNESAMREVMAMIGVLPKA